MAWVTEDYTTYTEIDEDNVLAVGAQLLTVYKDGIPPGVPDPPPDPDPDMVVLYKQRGSGGDLEARVQFLCNDMWSINHKPVIAFGLAPSEPTDGLPEVWVDLHTTDGVVYSAKLNAASTIEQVVLGSEGAVGIEQSCRVEFSRVGGLATARLYLRGLVGNPPQPGWVPEGEAVSVGCLSGDLDWMVACSTADGFYLYHRCWIEIGPLDIYEAVTHHGEAHLSGEATLTANGRRIIATHLKAPWTLGLGTFRGER